MRADFAKLVKEMSRAEIEKLLDVKDELETLEARRQELLRELSDVEKRLEKVAGQVAGSAGRKKAVRKTRAKAAKKTVKKAAKKTAKKTAKKSVRTAAKKGGGKQTVEDVVVQLIKKKGAPMPFKEILKTIVDRKLVKTRSKSFDNVLRRTLSTSDRLVNVSRGVYGLA